MPRERAVRPKVVMLVLAILCSLASLAALLARPDSTGSLRTALNVIAILLVVIPATRLAREAGRREA